jgi:hypothetical protein
MRLVEVKADTYPEANVKFQCLRCGRVGRAVDMMADLDGPAFKAYYCKRCPSQPVTLEEVRAAFERPGAACHVDVGPLALRVVGVGRKFVRVMHNDGRVHNVDVEDIKAVRS